MAFHFSAESVQPNCKKLLAIGTLRLRGERGGKGPERTAFSGPVMLPRKRSVPIAVMEDAPSF